MCLTLTIPQRIFFEYRYKLYQMAKGLVPSECYKSKPAALRRGAAAHVPQPSLNGRGRPFNHGLKRVQVLTSGDD